MEAYYTDNDITLYNQDCLEGLKGLAASSMDLIATDPPYGYSFMNKDWDTFEPGGAYQNKKGFKQLPRNQPFAMTEFFVPIWTECLRVLKPGAFAFVMCAPRQDVLCKQISALQEAGFNMGFSSLYHAYASGFPKASNIGKMVDKRLGTYKEGSKLPSSRENRTGEFLPALHKTTAANPQSPQAKALDGSYGGFQPKPAVEIILVCMKPLSEKTYVDQALKNGKGITWLDDCRVPYESEDKPSAGDRTATFGHQETISGGDGSGGFTANNKGRFPANLLVSDDVLNDGRVRNTHSTGKHNLGEYESKGITGWKSKGTQYGSDSGSFSRYFDIDSWWNKRLETLPDNVKKTFPFLIVPKASKAEKNRGLLGEGENRKETDPRLGGGSNDWGDRIGGSSIAQAKRLNIHPTCKPIKLMSYLLTLGSREGDVVLDPFIGSGTTAIAAKILGRRCIGFELDEGYCKITASRCRAPVQAKAGL